MMIAGKEKQNEIVMQPARRRTADRMITEQGQFLDQGPIVTRAGRQVREMVEVERLRTHGSPLVDANSRSALVPPHLPYAGVLTHQTRRERERKGARN